MNQIDIHASGYGADRFRVTSYGNGTAYAFHFGEAGSPMRTLFLQGEDATRIREEYDAAETRNPETPCRDHWLAVLDPYL